jgi:hypothetical protein
MDEEVKMKKEERWKLEDVEAALEAAYDDERGLDVLITAHYTGVADATQLRKASGLSRGQLNRLQKKFEDMAPGGLLKKVDFAVARPGKRGRPSTVYRLGEVGAALLRSHGYDEAHACGLTTETQIAHARGVLDVRLAAEEAHLAVETERELGYTEEGEERVLRPDNLITLPDGTRALFEVEQKADLSLLRRVRESVRHKAAFFTSSAGVAVSPYVRVLIDLPYGEAWERTVAAWERATAIVAEECGGRLPFEIGAIPLLDFLEEPDWTEPPDKERWESLFDPAQTSAFEPEQDQQKRRGDGKALTKQKEQKPRRADIPAGLKRRSAYDDYLVMEAFWNHLRRAGRELMHSYERPAGHPAFFETMGVIYAASHPPDATPWERALHPHASIYLLQQYLRIHPRLRKALSKAITRGQYSIKWSTPAITHRIQVVVDTFLRYHGLRSGGSITIHILGPWQRDDGRGDFGVAVSIEREVLMGEDDGVVPTHEETEAAEEALTWVLTALFAYSHDIGVKHAKFW